MAKKKHQRAMERFPKNSAASAMVPLKKAAEKASEEFDIIFCSPRNDLLFQRLWERESRRESGESGDWRDRSHWRHGWCYTIPHEL